MILNSFEVRPEVEKMYYGNQVEAASTGMNKVLIEVECSDKECDQLYKQFKGGEKNEM